MSASFSTAGMSVARQFPYFREICCEAVARLDARRDASGPYDAEVRAHAFGRLRFTDVRCDPVTIERTRADIAQDPRACFYLTLQLTGTGLVTQRGRTARLLPGDFTVVDGTEPYVLQFAQPVHRLVVQVPAEDLERRIGPDADARARVFGAAHPGAHLAFQALRALHAESSRYPMGTHVTLGTQVLDLTASVLLLSASASAAGHAAESGATLARIRAHVLARLRDPDLSPPSAASATGVSLRRLHQLFRDAGQSFGGWVRDQRLERCHADIADPALAHRRICDIAFSYGFNDATHFSRVFARKFGYPPSRLR